MLEPMPLPRIAIHSCLQRCRPTATTPARPPPLPHLNPPHRKQTTVFLTDSPRQRIAPSQPLVRALARVCVCVCLFPYSYLLCRSLVMPCGPCGLTAARSAGSVLRLSVNGWLGATARPGPRLGCDLDLTAEYPASFTWPYLHTKGQLRASAVRKGCAGAEGGGLGGGVHWAT